MANSYSPFSKSTDRLESCDLEVLKSVSEGWYVEYKSQAIKPADIAKSITSFANQYGGYLIFGVKQSGDQLRTAGSFDGIPTDQIGTLLDRIRDASSQHSNPEVKFSEKVIRGPCEVINLSSDAAIVVVDVPAGLQPPYVHSSGRIYRRVGDASSPKPETDRYLLDALWKRRDRLAKKLKRFVKERSPASRTQGIPAWLHLYLVPDPSGSTDGELITIENIADAFQKERMRTKSYSAPMDAVYSSGLGFCARQIGSAEAHVLGLTVEIGYDGWASFSIPINVQSAEHLPQNYETYAEFLTLLRSGGHQNVHVADLSSLSISVIALMNQLLQLKDAVEDKRNLFAGFEISGIRGVIPYLDSSAYIKRVEKFGFPIAHIDTHRFPAGDPDLERLVQLEYPPYDESDELHAAGARPLVFAGPLLNYILAMAGATTGITDLKIEDFRLDRYPPKDRSEQDS